MSTVSLVSKLGCLEGGVVSRVDSWFDLQVWLLCL